MLRSVGVPARTVKGLRDLREGTFTDSGDYQSRYSLKPHYWVEFFIPGYGWLQADPAIDDEYHGNFLGFESRGRLAVSVGDGNEFEGVAFPDRGVYNDVFTLPAQDPALPALSTTKLILSP